MIRDITIGQYYRTDSCIHSLDPRTKIIATMAYVVVLFVINDIYTYAFTIIALAFAVALSKVPIKFIMRGIKSILFIIILTGILNLFTTPGTHTVWQLGIVKMNTEGILMAVKMVVRLIVLIICSSLLTLTTTPIELTDGIEYLLKPFRRFGVPAGEIAMMMSIALRFIPTLLNETDKIIKAQQGRCADFDTGGIKQKAKSLIPVLVPLFISAFRRADELATAMESRCYRGGDGRTRMKVMAFGKNDYICLSVLLIFIAAVIIMMTVL